MGTMMRIGLTGGIAAGKSTVAARLKQLGALHIDYDALAHQIVEPGEWRCRRSSPSSVLMHCSPMAL